MYVNPYVRRSLLIGLALNLVGSPSEAQESTRWSFDTGVSTLGIMFGGKYQVSSRTRLRGNLAWAPNLGFRDTVGDIRYDFNWEGFGLLLLVDHSFSDTPFFLSGGVFISAQRYTGLASGSFIVNDEPYLTNLEARARLRNDYMPAFAMGYEAKFRNGLNVSASVGGIYTGGIRATLLARGGDVSDEDLLAERADFEDDFLDLYPFISVSVKLEF